MREDKKGNTGTGNTGENNSGHWNSGYGNSGYGNSTNRESGIFCSEQGTVRLFNKPTDKKWDEIDHPHFLEFNLNKWITESEMTDAEKVADPNFYVRGATSNHSATRKHGQTSGGTQMRRTERSSSPSQTSTPTSSCTSRGLT